MKPHGAERPGAASSEPMKTAHTGKLKVRLDFYYPDSTFISWELLAGFAGDTSLLHILPLTVKRP